MRTRTKRHTGVHTNGDLTVRGLIFFPRGNDHDAFSDLQRFVVLLPRIRPVLLLDTVDLDLTFDPLFTEPLLQEGEAVRNAALGGQTRS